MAKTDKKTLTQEIVLNAMDWAYDKAVCGIPGLDSAEEMANDYLSENGTLIEKVNRLIRWQNTKSFTSGFATGFGGFVVMPVTLPANITSVLYVQIRMIAAIAKMGGYDLKNDQVKSLVYCCLVASSASDVLKSCGVKVGEKLALNAVKNISRETITAINQKVGFKLLTKFGEKGVINLGKAIPVLGAFVGGTVDGFSTNTIGNVARDTFISDK